MYIYIYDGCMLCCIADGDVCAKGGQLNYLGGPVLQLISLLCFFLLVPSCFSCGMDWCQSGGEYFLPTDWWPHCRSCLMTPKARFNHFLGASWISTSTSVLACMKSESRKGQAEIKRFEVSVSFQSFSLFEKKLR